VSRASIVGVLIAVEVVIVGVALYVIGGAGGWSAMHPHGSFFMGMHHYSFEATPIAPLEAGSSPAIAVDDPDSRVEIGPSSDGLVHVKDLTGVSGARFAGDSSISQLRVTRTSNGVSIERPSHQHFFVFGSIDERIEIDAPPGSSFDVSRCSGADVSGIDGAVTVRSQDGHVTLADLHGTVDARSDDGYVDANGIHADSLAVESSDGHLALHDVAVATLTARTSDGSIEAGGLAIAGAHPSATIHTDEGRVRVAGTFAPGGTYNVSSNDGSLELALPNSSDLTVAASTGDGHIVVDGASIATGDDSDSVQHTIRLGDGSGSLQLSTSDGAIHISTNNGAV